MSNQPVGPVEIAVISFPGSRFNGEISPAIAELVDSGIVRILDVVVVSKTPEGETGSIELTDLEVDPFETVDGEVTGVVSADDVAAAAALLEPGSTAAVIVWENTWARRLVGAIANAGGELVAHDRIDAETVRLALAHEGSN